MTSTPALRSVPTADTIQYLIGNGQTPLARDLFHALLDAYPVHPGADKEIGKVLLLDLDAVVAPGKSRLARLVARNAASIDSTAWLQDLRDRLPPALLLTFIATEDAIKDAAMQTDHPIMKLARHIVARAPASPLEMVEVDETLRATLEVGWPRGLLRNGLSHVSPLALAIIVEGDRNDAPLTRALVPTPLDHVPLAARSVEASPWLCKGQPVSLIQITNIARPIGMGLALEVLDRDHPGVRADLAHDLQWLVTKHGVHHIEGSERWKTTIWDGTNAVQIVPHADLRRHPAMLDNRLHPLTRAGNLVHVMMHAHGKALLWRGRVNLDFDVNKALEAWIEAGGHLVAEARASSPLSFFTTTKMDIKETVADQAAATLARLHLRDNVPFEGAQALFGQSVLQGIPPVAESMISLGASLDAKVGSFKNALAALQHKASLKRAEPVFAEMVDWVVACKARQARDCARQILDPARRPGLQ